MQSIRQEKKKRRSIGVVPVVLEVQHFLQESAVVGNFFNPLLSIFELLVVMGAKGQDGVPQVPAACVGQIQKIEDIGRGHSLGQAPLTGLDQILVLQVQGQSEQVLISFSTQGARVDELQRLFHSVRLKVLDLLLTSFRVTFQGLG